MTVPAASGLSCLCPLSPRSLSDHCEGVVIPTLPPFTGEDIIAQRG